MLVREAIRKSGDAKPFQSGGKQCYPVVGLKTGLAAGC